MREEEEEERGGEVDGDVDDLVSHISQCVRALELMNVQAAQLQFELGLDVIQHST